MSQGFNEDKIAAAPEIRRQLLYARQHGASHMIRMRNTNTDEVFPLYVQARTGARQTFHDYVTKNGTHFDPFECYDMDLDLENQVLADRTVNWDKNLPVQTGPYSAVVPWVGLGPDTHNPPTSKDE